MKQLLLVLSLLLTVLLRGTLAFSCTLSHFPCDPEGKLAARYISKAFLTGKEDKDEKGKVVLFDLFIYQVHGQSPNDYTGTLRNINGVDHLLYAEGFTANDMLKPFEFSLSDGKGLYFFSDRMKDEKEFRWIVWELAPLFDFNFNLAAKWTDKTKKPIKVRKVQYDSKRDVELKAYYSVEDDGDSYKIFEQLICDSPHCSPNLCLNMKIESNYWLDKVNHLLQRFHSSTYFENCKTHGWHEVKRIELDYVGLEVITDF